MTGGLVPTAVVGRIFVQPSTRVDETTSRFVSGFACRSRKTLPKARLNNDLIGRSGGRKRTLVLQSSLTNAWQDMRLCSKVLRHIVQVAVERGDHHGPVFVDDLGGQYDESFEDVHKHMLDYFTYKGVRTVLAQLSEMNPHQYAWLYNFVVNNKPQDSKIFLRLLVKEKQELGERVMVTRLHLFNKWVKKYNHAQLHKAISDQNLELLRERLIQTVKFSNSSGDDSETPP